MSARVEAFSSPGLGPSPPLSTTIAREGGTVTMASPKGPTKQTKFIFVSGGVVSSLGKGLAAASIGSLLEARGLKITIQKLDPYLNVDPGTMNPQQHGEVFVTDDGA